MKRTVRAAILGLLLSTAAAAQEPAALSPEVRAYQRRLQDEFNSNMQCVATVLTLQDRVKVLEAELAKLKAPKKE